MWLGCTWGPPAPVAKDKRLHVYYIYRDTLGFDEQHFSKIHEPSVVSVFPMMDFMTAHTNQHQLVPDFGATHFINNLPVGYIWSMDVNNGSIIGDGRTAETTVGLPFIGKVKTPSGAIRLYRVEAREAARTTTRNWKRDQPEVSLSRFSDFWIGETLRACVHACARYCFFFPPCGNKIRPRKKKGRKRKKDAFLSLSLSFFEWME